MEKLIIKTKIVNPDLPTPPLKYAKEGDGGIDLTATSKSFDADGNVVYGTNRAFKIPEGHVGLLFPRSSNSKKDLLLTNGVGVCDSGYVGEVFFKYRPTIEFHQLDVDNNVYLKTRNSENEGGKATIKLYNIGDRIGQLLVLPYPQVEFEEVTELPETERGTGGYGSTGN